MNINHIKLRKLFADFWKNKNHKEVPPIPLVPKDDPTTLFTGSGMQQLVPYLLGETHPLGNRLYNIQPCLRAQDIEKVGDNRHDTFFEMLGNWSLGDYFKREQLAWFWEFLTKILKLPKEKLYVTVFAGTSQIPADEESYKIWKNLGVPEDHIFKYGPDENWWSRAGKPDQMPPGEPGGPDSEVFFEFTQLPHDKKYGEKCHPNCECGRFLEIGNSVFMEYKKNVDNTFFELPKKNVDFGGGIERIIMALENEPDQFRTSLYYPIIQKIEKITKKSYQEEKNKPAMRVIADHQKASAFLIKDGVFPSNKEQGYILRRLLRRSAVKLHLLKKHFKAADLEEITKTATNIYNTTTDVEIITQEIGRFIKTLERGIKEIKKIENITGKIAFDFYQSYGFPLELTNEFFIEKSRRIDRREFDAEFEKHKNLSRMASVGKFKGGLADNGKQATKYHTTTHILHQALFDVLGKDVRQEGSNITSERLRFDFYSIKKPTDEEIKKVESLVNKKIDENLNVSFKIMQKTEAEKLGAKSFFREKYPNIVKIYSIGNYSVEFCGGPHVVNTKEIGKINIYKFEKIGSNLYRIYAK